jgi:hypothetical protein
MSPDGAHAERAVAIARSDGTALEDLAVMIDPVGAARRNQA